MKRLLATTTSALALLLAAAAPASADFGLKDLDVTFSGADGGASMQAGSHPFAMTTSLDVNTLTPEPGVELPEGAVKDLVVSLPPGFVGSPNPVPYCDAADFMTIFNAYPSCPDATALGITASRATLAATSPQTLWSPVYNLKPPPGVAAKLGFVALEIPVTVEIGVNPDPPSNLIARVPNITQAALFYGSDLTLWGNPASDAHDPLRGTCIVYDAGTPEPTSRGECEASLPEKPFITLPRSCEGPLTTRFEATAWNTGARASGTATSHDEGGPLGMIGCQKLDFAPRTEAKPTSIAAESPTGLDFNLQLPTDGLRSVEGYADSDIKKAVVTLPAGMTVNPSQAEGLETCTEAQFDAESASSDFGAGCPGAAKIGTVEVETPLLEGKLLRGSVFVAAPYENPFNSLIALYMTIKEPSLGINVGLAGKVEPDPRTGQLITTFGEGDRALPQLPFSDFRFHFRGGGRSPLVTPPLCGTYTTEATFTPWASPSSPYTTKSSFTVTSGPNGAPCPQGAPPFKPGFEAGAINNNAGSFSPFTMRLTRSDGEQDMTKFSSVLPPGVTGKIAGVGKCSAASLAIAKTKSGKEEQASPSCPSSSRIGRVLAAAGVGSQLTFVPGEMYLAGPYKGAPLSIAAVTPAVAGPFDVGTVVVQVGLKLNPTTAEVEVDGSASDPIPHILEGIPLKLRELRVYVDRDNFTLNPTSCDPAEVRATLFGSFLDLFSDHDDVAVPLSTRYQAANCANLPFKPRLSIALRGGTKRGSFPALRAELRPRPGDANIGKAVVTLPRTAFLEQAHIRTICTRVQFAANTCPPGSVYGRARAFSPLLDDPLEGRVYLRSSSNPLPDMVVALKGLIDFNLVGRIDSVRGSIRASFETPPDVPVSKFVLSMQGGKKGLIVNSGNLCAHRSRASAEFTGQNGKPHAIKPIVKPQCKRRARGHPKRSP